MAPEVFQENYGTKADVWSCACVAHQMCTSNPPWKGLGLKSATSLYLHIIKHDAPPPLNCNVSTGVDADRDEKTEKNTNVNKLLLDLLGQCFIIDPIARPSARLLLTHAFFNDYDPNESSMFGDESVTSSLIDAREGSIATPTSLSMFSPLKLAAWKKVGTHDKMREKSPAASEKTGWPSWTKTENAQLSRGGKNPFAN